MNNFLTLYQKDSIIVLSFIMDLKCRAVVETHFIPPQKVWLLRFMERLYQGKPFRRNLRKERIALQRKYPGRLVGTKTLRVGQEYYLEGKEYTHGVNDGHHGSVKRDPRFMVW